MTDRQGLSGKEIQHRVLLKVEEYQDKSVLEQYALFMGKAQLLEFCLKNLLFRLFDVPIESTEKWTLGRTKNELKSKGLRPDFIEFLSGVVDYRNHMAHEFLANDAITQSFANFSEHKRFRELYKAIYELEQLIIFYDWCEENQGWNPVT
ncbi:hypothetical protein P3656_19920 [Vibrio parahaemolyticus]|uniref:hypothetical protein n=1 Tax=Pseudomonadati TaxID=3379134 RepID=UPI00146B5420|nr:hypothetical protein [Vibrio parahaemolyticus]EJE8521959.1 hypothetical protein [Vibrio parahaemolyticus]EJG1645974.1 hypothetical protein [Vibrio parahaemolyticus]ELA9390987.1 hypothetical protein [Vibrio parahaemolyticus]ELA9892405.1 hypothetical protein [Vibrio parahaemolyticus]MDF5023911.1 hypothetical protein [Vibrio parahaemolyticus]